MRTCHAERQNGHLKVSILKKTSGLCPFRSYYSIITRFDSKNSFTLDDPWKHCPKNHLIDRIKTEHVTVGANATVYMSCFCMCQFYSMCPITTPAVTCSASKRRFGLFFGTVCTLGAEMNTFLGQCALWGRK